MFEGEISRRRELPPAACAWSWLLTREESAGRGDVTRLPFALAYVFKTLLLPGTGAQCETGGSYLLARAAAFNRVFV